MNPFFIRCWAILISLTLWAASPAWGQSVDLTNRPIRKVEIQGLREVEPQLLFNQINTRKGRAYDPKQVSKDIENITRLGRFASVKAVVDPNPDGSVDVTYVVAEQKLLADVRVVGNKKFNDRELMDEVLLRTGDPSDQFLIERARTVITDKYLEAGYFLADVSVDQKTLDDDGILILRVREGPLVRVQEVNFIGNKKFEGSLLKTKVRTETYLFILRKGLLSDEQLDKDVATLRDYYLDRGFLDVRVGRQIQLSDNQEDAKVNFIIEEGPIYTVDRIAISGNSLYSTEQLLEAITLKKGEVYSRNRLRDSTEAAQDIYGKLGYVGTRVQIDRVFHEMRPQVDLVITINESSRNMVGTMTIKGNALTKHEVIYRQLRGIEPGRAVDTTGIKNSETRIRQTGLFTNAKITLTGRPEDEYRDVNIDVEEANTGSISLGAAVSSDSGVFGAFTITQRNFDLADTPESMEEFFSGKAFRGAGQLFSITLQPGTEFQRYQVNFREPYLLDSDLFLNTSAFLYTRFRESWDEERIGGTVGLGKRFGDVWRAEVTTRYELVQLSSFDNDAPIEALDDRGNNTVTALGINITRSTVDDRFFPTRGTVTTLGVDRIGLLGGDYDFTKVSAKFNAYLAVSEDFFGRKSVLSLRHELGYILENDEAPVFEEYYAGGHRNFRGYRYRGVGPRGTIRSDTGHPKAGQKGKDPVGGDFLFLLGLEYNFPIYEEFLRGVLFVDTGTVQDDFGLDQYRVAIGGGVNLKLPIFGQAPFALHAAIPVLEQDGDQERVISFSLDLPF